MYIKRNNMRKNIIKSDDFRSRKAVEAVSGLPFFSIGNLAVVEKNRNYLTILISRLVKRNKIVALKRGIYASRDYLEKIKMKGGISEYTELIANILCEPSYLSLEYVLEEYNVLTEISGGITLITGKKTKKFFNELGLFNYHHIKKDLFIGYKIEKKGDFLIKKASLAKALFDFLYLRKNIIPTREAAAELRLNFENIKKKDRDELRKYVMLEGSVKMKNIFKNLF